MCRALRSTEPLEVAGDTMVAQLDALWPTELKRAGNGCGHR